MLQTIVFLLLSPWVYSAVAAWVADKLNKSSFLSLSNIFRSVSEAKK